MQQKSVTLLKKIDSTIYQILDKFQDLFEKAVIDEKPKELLAVENAAMEFDALTIIRLCKDLLGITRGLRETWCLETIKVEASDEKNKDAEDEATKEVFVKFNKLIDRIAALEKASV
ncbi:hypothetical protein METBIDRAFT_47659 [Metschnikowia bicuspidata var. bicuspidata NRRL YB-4993]|uniref:Mediator of RNA polymerase II transcription subunit 22 n=1 Tax=Metschnikowia bicuspidata var. bicuspidata NRRL YB-4993 TaxID=869754 RepID=A0A1A0H220_9ASCO|nr:hypothetical protein METBIDRAFT_47659 [Metschnikowia bicuspidata var. bicuspidata NRRL YB-4993]OBA18000.1 hypothetical protein METBIDRAFT_47659 [Metschnikowia bicuspidata var. bicuspidata NRRL YB-4993]